MKKYLVLGTLAFAFAVSPVLAKDGGPEDGPRHGRGGHHGKMMEKMFDKIDADKDGAISKDEHVKFHDAIFEEMDADKDGKVTKEEAKAYHEAKRAKWKEMKDGRGDVSDDAAPVEPAPAEAAPPADEGAAE